jgi:predicted helicase
LKDASFERVRWQRLYPSARHDWLNISASDFDTLMPLTGEGGLFHTVFPGAKTDRNEWLYDFSKEQLIGKVHYFIEVYNRSIDNNEMDYSIKWSETLERRFEKRRGWSLILVIFSFCSSGPLSKNTITAIRC